MNYEEARAYVKEISLKKGSVLGLACIRNLMAELGNVQERLNVVHIAGTNGKGSVSAYVSQILLEAGYKVGRYTSPAVFDYLEVFSINHIPISEEEYAHIITEIQAAVNNMEKKGEPLPTAFEIETALAYQYFYRQQCDVVVVETGLGGIDDATNLIKNPLVSVITSISMDHMQFLGSTLEEIAEKKAGIIKRNSSVVAAVQPETVLEVIRQKAEAEQAALIMAQDMETVHYDTDKTICRYQSHSGMEYELETRMLGTFQTYNMAVAVETAEILKDKGLFIYQEHIVKGIRNAIWHGRFERIGERPAVYFDGGHNPGAAQNIRNTMEIYFTNKKIIYIIGVLADKDYNRVLSVTADLADYIITITPPDNPRALDGRELLKTVLKYHRNAGYEASLENALTKAKQMAGSEGIVMIFGSLSYLGKIKELMQ